LHLTALGSGASLAVSPPWQGEVMTGKSVSDVASEVRVSPMWVIAPLAALGTPAIFVIEILSGALEPRLVILFLLFYVTIALTWLLTSRGQSIGGWFLVTASVGMICLSHSWWGMPQLLTLMVIPPLLAAVLIGLAGTVLTTIGETVLLLVWSSLGVGTLSPATLATVIVTIWAALVLMYATHYRVRQLTEWSWNYFKQGQVLLEEARDSKVELQQALSDLTQANQQLTRMNMLAQGLRRMAEEARKVKEQFVAQVSHELRTPLNMIIGYTEVILQSPEIYGRNLPSALLADLTVIFRNAEHLSALIDDVLDMTEIETEQMALTKEEVQLHEIVNAAAIAVRPLFDSKGLYLKVDVPEALPPLFCDRTRIREVLLNLLSNGGRFTELGGVQVTAWQHENDLIVTVADTGPGIAAEDKVKLFQPFQQLSSSIRQRHRGSGLGLSISKRFLELHNGDIWVDSTVGVGTTFSFRLPIALPMPTEGELARRLQPDWEYWQRTRPSRAPKAIARPRFVVLDEDNTLLRFLVRYLENAEVVSVSTLEHALSELSDNPSSALVVNAASVGETLRRLEISQLPEGIPVMICTIPSPPESASTLGAFDYLTKPVPRNVLLATLDRVGRPVRSVLIVDDEPDMLRLYRRMLASTRRDCRVVQAKNGEEATRILRQRRPDVVLFDLVTAKGDGPQFLRAWNSEPATRNIPIIVTSANRQSRPPIASNVFAVTRRGGFSTREILTLITQTTAHLSTVA
jgi:signal transduction histidine kinase/CheY-like chemotaxis protein